MTITIDGLSIKKKEDFYANIKTELNVPEYFGNNLDALYDNFNRTSRSFTELNFFINDRMCTGHSEAPFCQKLLKVLQDADILTIINQH